ncbi:MAG: BMP family ABC transporter substrate-binding protein [Oscillospiraceae bacterium]|nr:BMP family ABC transporter substrate-binding protein [Oscillospiraceae bacterium]
MQQLTRITARGVIVVALCVLTAMFTLFACSGKGGNNPMPSTTNTQPPVVLNKDNTKIALLLCDAEMKSASARAAWLVLEKFNKETEIPIAWYMLPTPEDFQAKLPELIADGYTIIITNNGMHTDAIKGASQNLPQITFVAIEGNFAPKGESLEQYPTLIEGTVRAEESAFLAGYLLAKRSETGKIGMINGTQNPPGLQMQAGFEAGVAYASAEMGKEITPQIIYVGNGYNRTGGKEKATELYEDGCDILYFCAGGETDWGAIDAAKTQGKYCVTAGHTAYIAPGNVVGEVLKAKDPVLTSILAGLLDGTLKGGQVLDHGLNDQSAGFVKTALSDSYFGAELLAELDGVAAKIQSGEIQIKNH